MKYLDDEIESFLVDTAQRIVRMKTRRFQQLVRECRVVLQILLTSDLLRLLDVIIKLNL